MPLLLKLALIAIVLYAGISDLRTRRIPNWLNVSGVVLGLGLNAFLLRGEGLKLALLGMGLALLVYIPLYAIRGMGAGDVKLMAAIGAITGPQNWLTIFLATAIVGGVAALALILARKRLFTTVANLSTITTELLHARMPFHKDPSLDVHHKQSVGLPHGAMIAVASIVVLVFLS